MCIIPGLQYIDKFIDGSREDALLNHIDQHPWNTDYARRRQVYGVTYVTRAKWVKPDMFIGPPPDWGAVLAEELCAQGLMPRVPEQLLINEYLPGQGITSHADAPCFEDTIVSLSLGTACIMEFVSPADGKRVQQYLAPRSLLVLKDGARSEWKHSILGRKSDVFNGHRVVRGRRVSMTFRNVFVRGE